MSVRQSKKQLGRVCSVCGGAAGRKTVCARCSPRRATRAHRDKFANTRATENPSETLDTTTRS